MQQETIITKLKQVALKSSMRHKHAAVIVDTKGNALAYSYNYPKRAVGSSVHAEIAALNKFINAYSPRGHKIDYMIVIRVNGNSKLMNSKPCPNCTKTLSQLGIDVVHS